MARREFHSPNNFKVADESDQQPILDLDKMAKQQKIFNQTGRMPRMGELENSGVHQPTVSNLDDKNPPTEDSQSIDKIVNSLWANCHKCGIVVFREFLFCPMCGDKQPEETRLEVRIHEHL